MSDLKGLVGKSFKLVNTTSAGNIFSGDGETLLLKPVNRDYQGVSKKPLYYLNLLLKGNSVYLTGLFATANKLIFSGDFKDALGMKHIVKLVFEDGGKSVSIV